jgi:hypothetical protein
LPETDPATCGRLPGQRPELCLPLASDWTRNQRSPSWPVRGRYSVLALYGSCNHQSAAWPTSCFVHAPCPSRFRQHPADISDQCPLQLPPFACVDSGYAGRQRLATLRQPVGHLPESVPFSPAAISSQTSPACLPFGRVRSVHSRSRCQSNILPCTCPLSESVPATSRRHAWPGTWVFPILCRCIFREPAVTLRGRPSAVFLPSATFVSGCVLSLFPASHQRTSCPFWTQAIYTSVNRAEIIFSDISINHFKYNRCQNIILFLHNFKFST